MTAHPESDRMYRSIFLHPGWAHQRHLGWRVAYDAPGLRVLQRRYARLTKTLMLLTTEGRGELSAQLGRARVTSALSDLVIHDFDGVLGEAPHLPSLRLHRATPEERLLNIATFVVDLTVDEGALFRAMNSTTRNEIRKVEAGEMQVAGYDRPSDGLMDRFIGALDNLASERGLRRPRAHELRSMFDAGNSLLFVARDQARELHYSHVYTAGQHAYQMNTVNLSGANSDYAGPYIQWMAMKQLKASGYEWYDLGGVPSRNANDGIYRFKRRFGGRFVELGAEWRHVGPAAHAAIRTVVALRRLKAKRSVPARAWPTAAR